ncbi:MAG: lysR family transcriptional regulator [Burkholderiaceae bacterium]|nr:lysR family transcriptional regulator [Burkholderiaceae bacterium]
MRLNLHLLRIFFTVVEQQGFSRAAQMLYISQPATSKAVRELEHQLGLTLVERGGSGKGIRLTENGMALFEHARGIFALERTALDDMQARIDLRQGRLTVGASLTVAGHWLPAYVACFSRQFPSIDLRIQVGNTHSIAQALIDCAVDLALVEGEVNDPRIMRTPWRNDELAIVAAADSALARKPAIDSADLMAEIWLLREPGSGTREVNDRLMQQHHIRPRRILEFGSNEGIARAVAAGAGVAMLPVAVIRELLQVGELATLPYPPAMTLQRPLFLMQLHQRTTSPLIRAFCGVLE